MKSDELKLAENNTAFGNYYYHAEDVDEAIEELKDELNRAKAREDVLCTDNRDLLDKVKMLEERLRENAEHFKRNEAQILENSDKVIAEKDKEIAELKALNHDLCERVTENDEIRLHWEEIEQTRAENERMKARIAELEEERRWRNVDDMFPTADEGYILVLWEDCLPDIGYIGAEDDVIETVRDRGEGHSVDWWMPLPSAPKEDK